MKGWSAGNEPSTFQSNKLHRAPAKGSDYLSGPKEPFFVVLMASLPLQDATIFLLFLLKVLCMVLATPVKCDHVEGRRK